MQLSPFEEYIIISLQNNDSTPNFNIINFAQDDGYSLRPLLDALKDLERKGLVRGPRYINETIWVLTRLGVEWKRVDGEANDRPNQSVWQVFNASSGGQIIFDNSNVQVNLNEGPGDVSAQLH